MDNEPVVTEPITDPIPSSEPNPSNNERPDLSTELSQLNQQTIREQQETIVKLQNDLAQRNATPVVPQDDTTSFLNAPRQAIRDEVASQVKPLQDFVAGLTRDRAYEKLVNDLQFRAPKMHAGYLEVKGYVDQLMATQEPSPQNLMGAITMAKGAIAMGLTSEQPTPTPNKVTPPNIPPSAPPAPRIVNAGADRIDQLVNAMTESQRKAARLQGFTDMRQYIQFSEGDDMSIDDMKGVK